MGNYNVLDVPGDDTKLDLKTDKSECEISIIPYTYAIRSAA